MPNWNYAKSVPDTIHVACSGGVDSVATAAILAQWRHVTLLHYGHADHASEYERSIVEQLAQLLSVPVLFENSKETNPPISNKEKIWRDERYHWFHSFSEPVAVGHHLDDAVEWYLITCLRGRGEYMNYSNKNVIRPFLITKKEILVNYVKDNNLPHWDDPTNHDPNFGLRSRVRNNLVKSAVDCEPGLYNVIKKRIMEKISNSK